MHISLLSRPLCRSWPDQDNDIVGILAPHIEIAAAEKAYVDAYRRIKGGTYDLVIILGINHHGTGEPYCLTEKDYVTPLCTLATDKEFRLPTEGSTS